MTAPIIHERHSLVAEHEDVARSYRELWSNSPENGDMRSHRIVDESADVVRERKQRAERDNPGTLWERVAEQAAPAVDVAAKAERDVDDFLDQYMPDHQPKRMRWIVRAFGAFFESPTIMGALLIASSFRTEYGPRVRITIKREARS